MLAAIPGAALAGSLGIANDYNVFVLGSANQKYTDSEGAVAVGGNATYLGYGIGDSLTGFTGPALVVGGDLDYQQGSIFWGDVYVGGSASITNGGTITHGQLHNPSTFLDFNLARSYLTSMSTQWGAQATTGIVDIAPWNTITLTGTSSTLNVFNVSGQKLSQCAGLTINAPVGSTILVNVDGKQAKLANFGITLNGATASNVLYNYWQADSLTISGIDVKGSLLAPYAAVDFANGQINGTLVGSSLAGSGEAHNVKFTGSLPCVPEMPSSMLAMITGLIGLAGSQLRRRRG